MEQKKLDLTILAANYNNGPFLRTFIQSVLSSEKLPACLLIVDDGSTDESKKILKEFESLEIANFIYFENNKGFANALNKGIENVKTKYIMRADPDDIILPSKIEKQVDFLENNPEIAGVGCNVAYFHSDKNKFLNRSNFPTDEKTITGLYFKGEHGLQHPTVMIRTEAFKKFRYIQENVPAEDYDIFARMVADGYRFLNLKEVLYNMRIHDSSASSNLAFNTIKKTYNLRKQIFGISTPKIKVRFNYLYIHFYRKFLIENNFVLKYLFLLTSIFFHPSKLMKRLIK